MGYEFYSIVGLDSSNSGAQVLSLSLQCKNLAKNCSLIKEYTNDWYIDFLNYVLNFKNEITEIINNPIYKYIKAKINSYINWYVDYLGDINYLNPFISGKSGYSFHFDKQHEEITISKLKEIFDNFPLLNDPDLYSLYEAFEKLPLFKLFKNIFILK